MSSIFTALQTSDGDRIVGHLSCSLHCHKAAPSLRSNGLHRMKMVLQMRSSVFFSNNLEKGAKTESHWRREAADGALSHRRCLCFVRCSSAGTPCDESTLSSRMRGDSVTSNTREQTEHQRKRETAATVTVLSQQREGDLPACAHAHTHVGIAHCMREVCAHVHY